MTYTTRGTWTPLWRDNFDVLLARLRIALELSPFTYPQNQQVAEDILAVIRTGDWKSLTAADVREGCRNANMYTVDHRLKRICHLLGALSRGGMINQSDNDYVPDYLPPRPAPRNEVEAEEWALQDFEIIRGREIAIRPRSGVTCYKDDDTFDIYPDPEDGPLYVVVDSTREEDILRWVDEYLDPIWDITPSDPSDPRWEGGRSCWTYGRTYQVDFGNRHHPHPERDLLRRMNAADREVFNDLVRDRGLLMPGDPLPDLTE